MFKSRNLSISLIALLLASCGGGGSSGGDAAPSTVSVSGIVADGYLQGAVVFADLNENGVRDDTEPVATTDSGGAFTLQMPSNVIVPTVLVDVPATAIDQDTGQAVGRAYRLSTIPGQYGTINPVTTMLHAVLETHPGMTSADVESYVRDVFELNSKFLFTSDYLNPVDNVRLTAAQNEQNRKDAAKMHRVARVLAYYLAQQQGAALAAYGGQFPSGKGRAIYAVLANEVLLQAATVAGQLPDGDASFDPASIKLTLPPVTMQRLDAAASQLRLATDISLGEALKASDLYVYPYKNAMGSWVKLRVYQDLASSYGVVQLRTRNYLLSTTGPVEQRDYSVVSYAGVGNLFEGAYSYERATGRSTIAGAGGAALQFSVAAYDVGGDQIGNTIDAVRTLGSTAVWPAGARVYKALMTNVADFYGRAATAQALAGKLPDAILACCSEQGQDYRVGALGMRFMRTGVDTSGQTVGTIRFSRYDGAIATGLDTAGSWAVSSESVGKVLALTIPAAYRSLMAGLDKDPVFASNQHPPQYVLSGSMDGSSPTPSWRTPAGRVTPVILLNQIAADALEHALGY